MPEFTRRVRIDAPSEKVWAVLADFGGVSKWAPTITESRKLTEANGGVGARRTCTHVKMGEIEEEIVEWEDGRRYSYDFYRGLPMPMKSLNNDWSVESDGDGAVVTLRQNFTTKFGPLGSLMESLVLRRMMDKEITVTLAGLKYHTETGEISTLKVTLPTDAPY